MKSKILELLIDCGAILPAIPFLVDVRRPRFHLEMEDLNVQQ